MQFVEHLAELRQQVAAWRQAGLRIGLVPTMGNLHPGHLSLVEAARAQSDKVIATVFVNPMQFGENEDIDAYPRTLEADREQLEAAGADLLFAPPVSEVYPNGLELATRVEVPGLADILEGEHRPGHFTGVATVVAKLFNMVQPDLAVFGEKDFQQLAVIRQMVADLNLPIDIIGQPTVRDEDGLALSSRNGYLNEAERKLAPQLYRALQEVAAGIEAGEAHEQLEKRALKSLETVGFRPEYVRICRARDLQPPEPGDTELVILVAAWLGRARLIDNLVIPAQSGL